MGRPKKYGQDTRDVHIRIEQSLYDIITQMAKDEECTRTDMLRYLIYKGIR